MTKKSKDIFYTVVCLIAFACSLITALVTEEGGWIVATFGWASASCAQIELMLLRREK